MREELAMHTNMALSGRLETASISAFFRFVFFFTGTRKAAMISAGTFVFFSFVFALAYASSHDATNEEILGPGAFLFDLFSHFSQSESFVCSSK